MTARSFKSVSLKSGRMNHAALSSTSILRRPFAVPLRFDRAPRRSSFAAAASLRFGWSPRRPIFGSRRSAQVSDLRLPPSVF